MRTPRSSSRCSAGAGSGLVQTGRLLPESERLIAGFQRKVRRSAYLSDARHPIGLLPSSPHNAQLDGWVAAARTIGVRPHVVDRPVVARTREGEEPQSVKSAILLGALAAVAVSLVPQATAREHAAKTAAKTVVRPDPAAMRRVLAGIAHHARRDLALAAGHARAQDAVLQLGAGGEEPRVPQVGAAALAAAAPTRRGGMALNPPHKSQWLCIHGYEGSWTDPNSPYYGGLQMDSSSRRPTAATCCARRAPPTTGRRSSRCGSRSGRTRLAGSTHGRTRPGTVACCYRG